MPYGFISKLKCIERAYRCLVWFVISPCIDINTNSIVMPSIRIYLSLVCYLFSLTECVLCTGYRRTILKISVQEYNSP